MKAEPPHCNTCGGGDHTAALDDVERVHHPLMLPTGTRIGRFLNVQARFLEELLEKQVFFTVAAVTRRRGDLNHRPGAKCAEVS